MLAGTVRLIEFALVGLVGLIGYFNYVVPTDGFAWHYIAAILGIELLALLAFQVADIYQVQAFRGHEKQYMRLASAWSLVFLIVTGASFFAKAGEMFSRVWLGTFYVSGLVALMISRRLVSRRASAASWAFTSFSGSIQSCPSGTKSAAHQRLGAEAYSAGSTRSSSLPSEKQQCTNIR